MKKEITIIGIGMDGKDTLTASGLYALKSSDVIIGAERIVKPFESMNKTIFISFKPDEIYSYILECKYNKIAVLMSGDCGFYSGTEKLLKLLRDYKTDIICGISSPIYFHSKIGLPWHNTRFLSLHGSDANIVRNVCKFEKTFFLLGGKITAHDVCKRLCEYDLEEVSVFIGENLAYKNERILSGKASDFTDIETEKLCVMTIVNPNYEKSVGSCISDNEFIRGDIPMTKSEVRCICVSKLEIGNDSICWDIGCGTGSVSVEMALRCTDGKVFSVDKKSSAVELIERNRHKFRCDNIEIVCGDAEKSAISFPAPDCVFIGGSNGRLEEIIETAYNKNPRAKIVLTAVSLETLNKSAGLFDKFHMQTEITQLAVTRTKKIGDHTMLSAENPVFILKGMMK